MKIKFLGTSAGWPLPRLGHKCEICSSTDPKDTRLRSSALINESILIDAGPDTYQKLLKIDVSKIRYVILTHWHPDHTLGVWDLSHLYIDSKPVIFATAPTLARLRAHVGLEKLAIKEVSFGQSIDLEQTKFTNFEVVHTEGCFGVKLENSNKSLVYIPDFKSIPEPNKRQVKGVDLLVMDGSSLKKEVETSSHQSIETGIKLAKELGVRRATFTHLGHESGVHSKLEEYVRSNGGEEFFIPYDGLEVEV